MQLQNISIEQLRCLSKVQLAPNPKMNVIAGDNGSGKTSILEGLYLLGRGQSFRVSNSRRLIQDGKDYCVVRASVVADRFGSQPFPIVIQKLADLTRIRVGGSDQARLVELARLCPVLILEPGQHRLLEDGPILRRRYLDWSVFHVEQNYQELWSRFSRALKQRNAILRSQKISQLAAWDAEFVKTSEAIDRYRQKVWSEILEQLVPLLQCFLGEDLLVSVDYRRGWAKDSDLAEILELSKATDLDRGFTQTGPQRAELRVRTGAHLAREALSRGQQKLVVTAMFLAQAEHYRNRQDSCPILLIDDLASELGQAARERLYRYLESYEGQTFLTTLDATNVPEQLRNQSAMFHVKHGALTAQA